LILTGIAALTLAIWIYLLLFRGGFWMIRAASAVTSDARDRVAVVIPARDEAANIGATVRSLLTQEYAGEVHIFLVDDHSTDGTADLARAAAVDQAERLTIVASEPLPSGWTGKMWAVSQGVERALGTKPDWILLTDADIVQAPDSVVTLVGRGRRDQLSLVSYMVRLRCESFAERALVPAFVYFFLKLYPPAWILDHKDKTAGAAGGCMLVKPEALVKAGGIASIRNELIDDCALARGIKHRAGGRVWLGCAAETESVRDYRTFGSVGKMIARTAYTQLAYSPMLLIGTVIGMVLTYLAAPVLTFVAPVPARWLALSAWVLMTISYLPVLVYYRRSYFWALALPLIAAFYSGATVWSAVRHWQGRGGEWKGRTRAQQA
jgi:hopene-associated glycosyltransferase HpnB